jgi:hypothetical protein
VKARLISAVDDYALSICGDIPSAAAPSLRLYSPESTVWSVTLIGAFENLLIQLIKGKRAERKDKVAS